MPTERRDARRREATRGDAVLVSRGGSSGVPEFGADARGSRGRSPRMRDELNDTGEHTVPSTILRYGRETIDQSDQSDPSECGTADRAHAGAMRASERSPRRTGTGRARR